MFAPLRVRIEAAVQTLQGVKKDVEGGEQAEEHADEIKSAQEALDKARNALGEQD